MQSPRDLSIAPLKIQCQRFEVWGSLQVTTVRSQLSPKTERKGSHLGYSRANLTLPIGHCSGHHGKNSEQILEVQKLHQIVFSEGSTPGKWVWRHRCHSPDIPVFILRNIVQMNSWLKQGYRRHSNLRSQKRLDVCKAREHIQWGEQTGSQLQWRKAPFVSLLQRRWPETGDVAHCMQQACAYTQGSSLKPQRHTNKHISKHSGSEWP